MSPSWPMALLTGRPAGSRYPVPPPGSASRPQAARPYPRRRMRWRLFRGSPTSPAASANASAGWLADLADAATIRYLSYGHGNGIMLVHSATAPGAVLRTLPALDTELWAPSLAASWAAAAALTAVYAPPPRPRAPTCRARQPARSRPRAPSPVPSTTAMST